MWLPTEPPRAVLYLNDGRNVFADRRSRRPKWHADEVAAHLIKRRRILPLAIVGIDQAPGNGRSRDYLPYPDPRNARARQFQADRYVDFVVGTVIPRVTRLHPEIARVASVGVGGASYGAIAALHAAVRHPIVFDRLLLESPPLWVGDGRLIAEAAAISVERAYLGIGTRESPDAGRSAKLVALARRLARELRANSEVRLVVGEAAPHHERAWEARLPRALRWLFPA